jgi:rhodanese-related sulfurtransferase
MASSTDCVACDLSFQQKSLFQQGYQSYTPEELRQLEWGLRFTPSACTGLSAYALYIQSPTLLFIVSGLGFIAFLLPSHHPMDLLYNHFIRHVFGAIALPENPLQRRLACFSAGGLNIIAAVLFLMELPILAIITGVSLIVLQIIVITTHFCTLSWMYELFMRAIGKWELPVSNQEVEEHITKGAVIIDVRSQAEFEDEHFENALNFPLENLKQGATDFPLEPALLYCNSGMRSHIASQLLAEQNILSPVYNAGGMNKLKEIWNIQ